MRFLLMLVGWIFLTACTNHSVYAPVMDASTIEKIPRNGAYVVQPHETLYSIAWRYGMDYRHLANINQIAAPYHIEVGQKIYLKGKPLSSPPMPVMRPVVETKTNYLPSLPKPFPVIEREPIGPVKNWVWPAHGRIVGAFSSLNKGINIAGHRGDPVYATAPGKVVYSNNGLRGYGNLIIIKHNSSFLSAYAQNSVVLVKEGDWVKAHQKIAEIGNTGSKRVMLHFEIRRNGRPVNPLRYLPSRR